MGEKQLGGVIMTVEQILRALGRGATQERTQVKETLKAYQVWDVLYVKFSEHEMRRRTTERRCEIEKMTEQIYTTVIVTEFRTRRL